MTDTCPIEGCASLSSTVPKLQVWSVPECGAVADMHFIPVSINNHAQHHPTTCTIIPWQLWLHGSDTPDNFKCQQQRQTWSTRGSRYHSGATDDLKRDAKTLVMWW